MPDHNHSAEKLLGRTVSGTLKLFDNDLGFKFRSLLPDTQCGHDIREMRERGDLRGMSFSFSLPDQRCERWLNENGLVIREIDNLNCYDVPPVVWPAYSSSTLKVSHRCLEIATRMARRPGHGRNLSRLLEIERLRGQS